MTASVVDAIGSSAYLDFDPIGEVELKGFRQRRELFVVRARGARRPRVRRPLRGRNPSLARVTSWGDARGRGGALDAPRRRVARQRTRRARVIRRRDGLRRRRLGRASPRALTRCSARRPCTRSHVNYGLRAGAGDGRGGRPRLCGALRIDLHVERPRPAAGQPSGDGPRAALRRGRAPAPAQRLDRVVTGHTPHRPRRDRSLPPRRLARLAGAARAARREAAGSSARCSGSSASGCAELVAIAGPAVRRRRDQRRPDLRPQPDPRRGAAGAARPQPGGRARQRRRDPRRARRGGGAARPRRSRGARPGRRRRRRRRDPGRRRSHELEPACAAWPCARLAERAAGRPVALGRRRADRDRAARRRRPRAA